MYVTSRKPDISPYCTKQGKHNGSGCTQIPIFTYNFTALQTRLLCITNKTSFECKQDFFSTRPIHTEYCIILSCKP